ncbi:hypothetical protein FOL47_007110 [Perkinsus chesapeaki]|uniref:FK506-binding protein 5 n=1 Tax=Perkinsus chesapeaki TaxID=330153 RepID=A0A7J6MW68_PERCH|nr:hypothetical protein FOL47_007110 [Perkinsus chesapeaki]
MVAEATFLTPATDASSTEGKEEEDKPLQLDEDSLLMAFGSEEAHRTVEWCRKYHPRSDIFECRLEDGGKLKNEGNDMVKEGKWREAAERYLAALYEVDFSIGQQWQLTNEHQHLLDTIKLSILNNLCLAYLHIGIPDKASKAADLALKSVAIIDRMAKETEGLNSVSKETKGKVYFRRGRAQLLLGQYDRAYGDAKEAYQLCPSDAAVQRLKVEARRKMKEEDEKATRVWKSSAKKMFSKDDEPAKTRESPVEDDEGEIKTKSEGWISWLMRCSLCRRRKRD